MDSPNAQQHAMNRNVFSTLAVLISLVMLSAPCHAQIYKWTDKDGNVHFGDRAQSNTKAEEVEPKINILTPVEVRPWEPIALPTPSPQLTMFATKKCGYCKRARAYFHQQNIPYTEEDINADKDAYRRFKQLGGRGVPLFVMNGRTKSGFSPGGFEAFRRSAQ